MTPAALVVLAAGAHLAPLPVSSVLGHSQAAWEYVAFGIESAMLWLVVGAMSRLLIVQAVAAWGAFEGAQRAACRLALPMDAPPKLPAGMNLCDVATGLPMSLLSLAFAAVVVLLIDLTR